MVGFEHQVCNNHGLNVDEHSVERPRDLNDGSPARRPYQFSTDTQGTNDLCFLFLQSGWAMLCYTG